MTNVLMVLSVSNDDMAELGILRPGVSDVVEPYDPACGEEFVSHEDYQKLQRFKDFVHKRLDDAGIEKDPPGPHRDAGCRIGQRLDLVLGASPSCAPPAYIPEEPFGWTKLVYTAYDLHPHHVFFYGASAPKEDGWFPVYRRPAIPAPETTAKPSAEFIRGAREGWMRAAVYFVNIDAEADPLIIEGMDQRWPVPSSETSGRSEVQPYIPAMADAAERYLTSRGVRTILPATFRWEDLWIAMRDARRRT